MGGLRARFFPGDVAKASGETEKGKGGRSDRVWVDVPVWTRLARVALWVLVVVGALGGVVAGCRPQTGTGAPRPGGEKPVRNDVGGFGASYVAAWIEAGEGTEATLAPFYGGQMSLSEAPRTFYASRAETVQLEAVEDDYWVVTVSADVLEQVKGTYEPVGRRYYQVGIWEAGAGQLVATGLPAQVGAPERGEAPALASSRLTTPPDGDPVAESVDAFLAAYLTGVEGVDRYLAPSVELVAPDPAPFTKAELVGVDIDGSGGRRDVAVVVTATSSGGSSQVLQYQLQMRARAGRWEVSALSGAAELAPPGEQRRDGPVLSTTTSPNAPPPSDGPSTSSSTTNP